MACCADHPKRVGSNWPSGAAALDPAERSDVAGRRSLIVRGTAEPYMNGGRTTLSI